jgi:hypothetical protein
MNLSRSITMIIAVLVLSGCGTTSDIKPTDTSVAAASATTDAAPATATYGRYQKVVVLDFEDRTDKARIPDKDRAAYEETMKIAVRDFSDRIAGEIRKTGAFTEVLREPSQDEALLISGGITRYAAGNAMLRLFIGFGAGSSYFDATVDLSDNATGERLAQVVVDKNSWGLGGAIAASQNVEGFMQGAAEKIATDLAKSKQEPVASSSN